MGIEKTIAIIVMVSSWFCHFFHHLYHSLTIFWFLYVLIHLQTQSACLTQVPLFFLFQTLWVHHEVFFKIQFTLAHSVDWRKRIVINSVRVKLRGLKLRRYCHLSHWVHEVWNLSKAKAMSWIKFLVKVWRLVHICWDIKNVHFLFLNIFYRFVGFITVISNSSFF